MTTGALLGIAAVVVATIFAVFWLRKGSSNAPKAQQCPSGSLLVDGVCQGVRQANLTGSMSTLSDNKPACVDKDSSHPARCPKYASAGYCHGGEYRAWMMRNCEKTCAEHGEQVPCALRSQEQQTDTTTLRRLVNVPQTTTGLCSQFDTSAKCLLDSSCGWEPELGVCMLTRAQLCTNPNPCQTITDKDECVTNVNPCAFTNDICMLSFCVNDGDSYCNADNEVYDTINRVCHQRPIQDIKDFKQSINSEASGAATPHGLNAEAACNCTSLTYDKCSASAVCQTNSTDVTCTSYETKAECTLHSTRSMCRWTDTCTSDCTTQPAKEDCNKQSGCGWDGFTCAPFSCTAKMCSTTNTNTACDTCGRRPRAPVQTAINASCHRYTSKGACTPRGCGWVQNKCQFKYAFLQSALETMQAQSIKTYCKNDERLAITTSVPSVVAVDGVPYHFPQEPHSKLILQHRYETIDVYSDGAQKQNPATVECVELSTSQQSPTLLEWQNAKYYVQPADGSRTFGDVTYTGIVDLTLQHASVSDKVKVWCHAPLPNTTINDHFCMPKAELTQITEITQPTSVENMCKDESK